MAVTVDSSSLKIDIHDVGVKPVWSLSKGATVWRDIAFVGSANAKLSHAKDHSGKEPFGADGQVRFSLDPGDTLDDWKVGFVQIVRFNHFSMLYAGRIPSEGMIVCEPFAALPKRVYLDSISQTYIPFYDPPVSTISFRGSVAKPDMEDGPDMSVPLLLSNDKVSHVDNFLWNIRYDIEFWTILTAMGPDKVPRYLAHFHWHLVYELGALWRGGEPISIPGGFFKRLESFVSGPPADKDLKEILSRPTAPLAKDVLSPALKNSLVSPSSDPRIHRALPERDLRVPDFFWG